eukprot:TRINITY_DN966_c0_g2_i1.p1 TRINITY_DN966_c0_g2~~TRINITY_DN966_c0_g2_i1.p1  ORF type:complete len:338 (-),score=158.53 TRINITY_DN966_c0_g2_i1:137-1150(-)
MNKLPQSIKELLTNYDFDADREILYRQSIIYRDFSKKENKEIYANILEAMDELLAQSLNLSNNNNTNNNTNTNNNLNIENNTSNNNNNVLKKEKVWYRLEQSVGDRYVRAFNFNCCNYDIQLNQQFADCPDTLGLTVWDGSLVLAKYLEKLFGIGGSQQGWLIGKQVLELGAGCGLVGIALAFLGAHVTLTDFSPDVLQQLKENIDLNFENAKQNNIIPIGTTKIKYLKWGEQECDIDSRFLPIESSTPKEQLIYDVIIGADVVYNFADSTALLNAIKMHSKQDSLILVSCEHYDDESPKNFQQRAREMFNLEKICMSRLNEFYQKESIDVWQLTFN